MTGDRRESDIAFDAPPAATVYLDRCRRAEDAFVEAAIVEQRRRLPRPVAFLLLHAMQLFWTIRRLVGLDPQQRKPRPPRPQKRERRYLLPVAACASQRSPRVLIDVTHATRSPIATGIQRVVRECAREAAGSGAGWPVTIEDGAASAPYAGGRPEPVERGDTLLLLDSNWHGLEHLLPLLREIKAKDGRIVTCIYDLIPIQYPTACDDRLVKIFKHWLETVLPLSDAILTNAQAVARDIRRASMAPNVPVAVFPLACGPAGPSGAPVKPRTIRAFEAGPTFLSVGTIEPRKGYPIALDAFEALWARGSPARYVILGRTGWRMAHFEQRLLRHRERDKRLVWLRDAGDADLAYAYAHARALIAPSIAEGFGLPIVEAARAGLPVVASDIAVFREIGRHARSSFFAVADPADLARRISALCNDASAAFEEPTRPIPSWREATEIVTTMVRSPRLYQAGDAILTPADFGLL